MSFDALSWPLQDIGRYFREHGWPLFTVDFHWVLFTPFVCNPIQVDKNGAGSFSFSKKELVGLYGLSSGDPSKDYEDYLYRYGYSMVVNATFTEELTDKKGDGQAILRFYKTGVKINFPDYNPSSFKPGLEYIALVGDGTFTSGYSPKE